MGTIMGRIRGNVVIKGRECWTLFDTGSRNNYVVSDVTADLPCIDLSVPQPVSLGGKVHEVLRICALECLVQGLPMQLHARVLDEIGKDEDDRNIEVLFGALSMQEWGIIPVPEKETLDLTHYPKEFVEFCVSA